jgi:mannose-6-phosphate isomerase-like protein (cupin superfamily)
MSDYAVKRIDEMEAVFRGAFKRARAELGAESFGLGIIDMPPNYENYPEHEHAEDGQEEVYVTLRGGGEIEIDGERFPLDPDHVVRVASGTKRKVWPGDDGIRLLVIGGVPGGTYQAPEISNLGEPDPMAS